MGGFVENTVSSVQKAVVDPVSKAIENTGSSVGIDPGNVTISNTVGALSNPVTAPLNALSRATGGTGNVASELGINNGYINALTSTESKDLGVKALTAGAALGGWYGATGGFAGGAATGVNAATTGGTLGATTGGTLGATTGGALGAGIASGIGAGVGGALVGAAGNLAAGYLSAEEQKAINQQNIDARIAADALNYGRAQTAQTNTISAIKEAQAMQKFNPVGVTNAFGTSSYTIDPTTGQPTASGYTLNPWAQGQMNTLQGVSDNALTQYQGAQSASAPMGTGAQTMFGLGNQYLQTDPAKQAQMYYDQQQALLGTSRARELATLQNQQQARGTSGLAMGATGTMGAANPQMEAYYNALRQQDLGLAAQATQGGMEYAKFGAGMIGQGGQTLQDMYKTQSAAYNPYSTAMGGITDLNTQGMGNTIQGWNMGNQLANFNQTKANNYQTGMANAYTAGIGQPFTPSTITSPGNPLSGALAGLADNNQFTNAAAGWFSSSPSSTTAQPQKTPWSYNYNV